MTKTLNKIAPNFKIPSTNSKLLELKKVKSKYKVLYFYPKDNTPGCTIETKDFNSLLSQFKKLDCEVIGISKDSMESHEKFRDKFKIKFDLVSDIKKEAIKAYKVWGKKKFMGREFMGLIRSTFLLKNDKIIKEWRSVKVKDHAKEVLKFLKTVE
jgi:peroxiredoxin Q/BCP